MSRRLAISVFLFLFCFTLGAATYYIDYDGGDDSNAGTATGTAWQRHPYMNGFSGSYSHSAGDQFIFKGGVTWPNTCFVMNIVAGGSVGNRDYYGVDDTWYTGASWTRPIFDAEDSAITGGSKNNFVYMSGLSYITFENIKHTRFYWDSTCQTWPDGQMYQIQASTYITWSYCLFDDWSHGSGATQGGGGYGIVGKTSADWNPGTIVEYCTFDGSTTKDSLNAIYGGIETVRHSTFHDLPLGILSMGDDSNHVVHDNTIYNIVDCFDAAAHEDALYFFGGGSCYNNKIYTVVADGMALYLSPSWASNTADLVAYNNIVWDYDAFGNGSITVDGEGGNFTGAVRIFNNTLEGGNSATGPAIRIAPRNYTFTLVVTENNHMITSYATGILEEDYVTTHTKNNNLLQTSAEATAEGYVTGNEFAPTSGGSTIDAGTDESSYFANDILSVSRPKGSTWDIGAYEYNPSIGAKVVMILNQIQIMPIFWALFSVWAYAAVRAINKFL